MNWRVVPVTQWPGEPTAERKSHPFRKQTSHGWMGHGVNWSSTIETLERELEQLGADDVLLQMEVTKRDIRNDGWIRADARPKGPGIILTFESKHGPLSYPCDTFTDWQANVRAVALSLEALRKVDRYGVTRRGEQYSGFTRLAAKIDGGPHEVLAKHSGLTEDEVRADPKRAYRRAAMNTHPDRGGSGSDFSDVAEAGRVLGVK